MKYKFVLQHDSADCGPACIATICKYYNKDINLSRIREVAGTDKQGTNLYGMQKACKHLGLQVRVIRAKEKRIPEEVPLPVIAHLKYKDGVTHYVVIYKITKDYLVIADPGKGIVKKTCKCFLDEWTGNLILTLPSSEFTTDSEHISLFSRYKNIIWEEKKILSFIIISSLIYTIIGIGVSYYYSYVMDNIIYKETIEKLNWITILTIALYLVRFGLEIVRGRMQQILSNKLDSKIMLGFYKHTLSLPLDFFETRRSGEIITRFGDAEKIREIISGASLTLIIDTAMAILGGILLAKKNPKLFIIAFIIIIIYAFIVIVSDKPLHESNKDLMSDNEDMTSYLIENIKGIETIKSFNYENRIMQGTTKKFNKYLKSIFRNSMQVNWFDCTSSIVYIIGEVSIIWIGFVQVMKGQLTLGEVFMFDALLGYFLSPIENLIFLVPSIKSAMVASQRVNEIVDLESEIPEEKLYNESDKKISLYKDIEFKNISFRYRSSRLLIEDVSLSISKGEKVAFVGPSGSGKTTLVKLLMNYYKLESGNILLGGKDINSYDYKELRAKIAYVSQDIFLYPGTIIENMTMGNSSIKPKEIENVCKMINAHEFIERLPLKYNSKIGEDGVNLSYGQRQRISIARALLKDPDILIMDEATSNLDSLSERCIDKAISELSNEVTVILIAHRLSTIMRCDKIFVVENGKIVDVGTHKELLKRGGVYAQMWQEQTDNNL